MADSGMRMSTYGTKGIAVSRLAAGLPKRRSPRATMRRILTAAAEEFAAHGLSGAQMIRIAENASVSKQLVYHYFSSKEDIHTAVLEDIATLTMQDHLRANYDSMAPDEAVKAFLYQIFDSLEKNPIITALTLSENMNRGMHISSKSAFRRMMPVIKERLNAILTRGKKAQMFRDDVDPNLFFATCLLLTEGCFLAGNVMSIFLSIDLMSPDGRKIWREYAAKFILDYLRSPPPAKTAGRSITHSSEVT
jgi:TetR/AcrR family transcriptional regulator